jgi:hypothetical protein
MKRLYSLLLLLLLAGCLPAAVPTLTPLPVPVGEVRFLTPQTGAILYAPQVFITGSAQALPAAGFRLHVVTAEDVTLYDDLVQPQAGAWAVTLANPVTDTPVEITLTALPAAPGIVGDYDVVSVVLSAVALRPPGVFGLLLSPLEGETTGGDVLPVAGTISGLDEGSLTLLLEQPDGTPITQQGVTVTNPGLVDEVPWFAEIATQGYRGPAVLRVLATAADGSDPVLLDALTLTLAEAAG